MLPALKGFQDHLKGQRVLICSDKSTVVSYMNKEGGTHSIEMCALIWRILANPRNSHKSQKDSAKSKTCTWIPKCDSRLPIMKGQGHTNRMVPSPTDIQPNLQSLAQTNIRLVCNSSKSQTSNLCISCPRQKGLEIDALNICWEGLDGYVFCPVAILPQVIQKIITYPCRMMVLAPLWPGMPWFWDLSTRVPLQFSH